MTKLALEALTFLLIFAGIFYGIYNLGKPKMDYIEADFAGAFAEGLRQAEPNLRRLVQHVEKYPRTPRTPISDEAFAALFRAVLAGQTKAADAARKLYEIDEKEV